MSSITVQQVNDLKQINSLTVFLAAVKAFAYSLTQTEGQLSVSDWIKVEDSSATQLQLMRATEDLRDMFDYFTNESIIALKSSDSIKIDGYDVILTARFKNGQRAGHNFRYVPSATVQA